MGDVRNAVGCPGGYRMGTVPWDARGAAAECPCPCGISLFLGDVHAVVGSPCSCGMSVGRPHSVAVPIHPRPSQSVVSLWGWDGGGRCPVPAPCRVTAGLG